MLTIGRYRADVVIDDPKLSRRHLEVRPDGDALIVEDLGSTNGTYVDDCRIDRPTQLRCGARVKLGSTVFEVEVIAAQVQATSHTQRPDDPNATCQGAPPQMAVPTPGGLAPGSAPPLRSVQPEPVAAALGAFSPPSPRRRGGLASRSWVPVALSFGSAIATAITLVIYFAQR